VHRRIQAYYGEEGRLRIASAPVLGTSISILVPIEPPTSVEIAA
jgi:sensor histidine kinase YesM